MKNRTKKGLFLFVICVLCTAFGQAQRITVSGSVKGNEGAPVPGANIVEKGTTNGVSTDFDGNYQIEVASDAV
ncbi:MAG TPA: carboxypeptidase-like regulatory domain-containing protein, partial [Allomuricauda sp.]|nr:carboxypeptidase-like regulatory domain-containing protein [Allomuricauda sp.]